MSVRSKPNREVEAPAEPERDGSDLPEGWASGRFDSIAELNPRHQSGLDDAQLVTFVPMTCVSESSPDFDRSNERALAEVRKGYTHFADGDVLFAKITPCMENGKGAVASGLKNGLGCGTTELHVIRPLGGIDPHYVYRFLQQESVRRDAAANFTGSAGQLRAPMSFIAELELPLPPLAEQRRIVGKLELLLGKVSSSHQRLSRVPRLLKRFRQSVLAAACSGKLTADWREENEPKSAAGRWNLTAQPLNSDELPDVPPTWVWRKIDDISERVSVGHVGPTSKFYCSGDVGIPFVRSQNVRPARLAMDDSQFITREFHDSLRKSQLRAGDILIVRVGANRGDTCKVPDNIGVLNCANIVFARPFAGISDYIEHYCQSKLGQDLLLGMTTGSAQGVLNTTAVAELAIPIPPETEQQEIVRRVEKLFAFADQIEARLKQAQTHVDRITQSLLAKAFRGELVPTEYALATAEGREYESASELLSRIRGATGAETNGSRTKKRVSKGR